MSRTSLLSFVLLWFNMQEARDMSGCIVLSLVTAKDCVSQELSVWFQLIPECERSA